MSDGANAAPRPARARAALGFTLIEVVVVLFIVSILAAAAIPAFRSEQPLGDLDEATSQIEALLRLARDSAIRGAQPVTVVVDSASSLVWLTAASGVAGGAAEIAGPGTALDLPLNVKLDVTSARARFTFRPDGSAFPDSVYLTNSSGARLITLNPWTGHALVYR